MTRLQSEGISATQATVTRDLQELGTIKVRDENGVRRIVAATASKFTHAPLDHLRRMMGEWVVSVESSENLVVVRTPPGCAHVVASALDRSALDGVLGSVAGDDTILVIADEKRGGMSLAHGVPLARRTRRIESSTMKKEFEHDQARRARLQRGTGHVGRDSLDDRRVGRRSRGVLVDVGQDVDSSESFDDIKTRALAAGAIDCVVVDARDEMAEEFCAKAILANARYEGKYPLVSALSRPVIVRHLVAQARQLRRAGRRARLHRQGQRPGALRSRHARAGARPRGPRAGAELGDDARRLGGLRREVGHPDQGDEGEDLLDRREPLGTGHRVRRDRGPVGRATRRALHA